MRGQAADATERGERSCALRKRWFGDVRTGGAGAGVLSGRHESMVAKPRNSGDTRRLISQFSVLPDHRGTGIYLVLMALITQIGLNRLIRFPISFTI